MIGRYELIERLGRGGMGEVWLARIDGPGGFMRLLVVKRILASKIESPRFVSRFVTEARLSARLHHPNIVQVFEFGEVEGEYFLAMEYLEGSDLDGVMSVLARRGPPDPGLGALVTWEVSRALAYAHKLAGDDGKPLNLVHRDVSPSNILLGYEGAVKLADFGLARALAESPSDFTHTGIKGKLGYVSPEMAAGRKADHRSDQWALGVVLHETLTARRLFTGVPVEVLALVSSAPIDPPSRLNPAVPPDLDRICMRALARDPDERFPSCAELGYELERVVHELRWSSQRLSSVLQDAVPKRVRASTIAPISPAEMEWVIETTSSAQSPSGSPTPPLPIAPRPLPRPVVPPLVIPATPHTAPPISDLPRSRRGALWLSLAIIAALAVSALWWWQRKTPANAEAPAVDAPRAITAPPAIDPPPAGAALPAEPAPAPIATKSAKPPVRAKAPARPKGPSDKPVPDIETGAVVDPFASP